jgi:hypothetical protein
MMLCLRCSGQKTLLNAVLANAPLGVGFIVLNAVLA